MMKKLKSITLAVTLMFFLGILNTNVHALNSNVTFMNEAEEFVVYPLDKDLFSNFKDVMPGSTYEQVIEVANDVDNDFGIDMYLRMDPITEENREFLKYLMLTIEVDGEVIYQKTLDENEGFENFVHIAALDPGDTETLDLTLKVPIELENKFADTMGFVDWVFMIEDYDVKGIDIPVKPKPVLTGIGFNALPYIILASGVISFVYLGKKEKNQ